MNTKRTPGDFCAEAVPAKRRHLDTIARFKKRFRTTPKARPTRTSIEQAARVFADWLATKPELTDIQYKAVHRICLDFTALVVNGEHPVLKRGLEQDLRMLHRSADQ